MNYPPDIHMHTPLCKHALGRPLEYVRVAALKGIPEICFTDHAPAPGGYDPDSRMSLEQFPDYQAMVEEAVRAGSVTVRFGIEADYYADSAAFLETWLDQQTFDLVLGSVHCLGDWGFDNEKYIDTWKRADVVSVWRDYFSLIGELADTRLYDVVGHVDLPKKFGYRVPDLVLKELAQPALDKIAAAGMAIELNTAGLRKPVREIYPSRLLLELAYDRDIPIAFGSDAHTPGDVGADFDQAIALARAVGYTRSARYRQRRRTLVPL